MTGAANGDGDNTPEDQGDPEGWKHTSKLHTCHHCNRIVITYHQLKHGLVSLPHTKSEVLEAEADGCPVFAMLTESWRMIAHHRGPTDLRAVFTFLSDPYFFGNFDSLVGSTARSSEVPAQNKAWSNKTTMLLWNTQFILASLRRRHFHLFVSSQWLKFLHGTASAYFGGQLRVLEGKYMDNLSFDIKRMRGLTWCCAGREGAIDAGVDISRSVFQRNLGTESLYVNLKQTLSICLSSHKYCQISPVGFAPSRLLQVSPDSGPNHVRLVKTTSDGQWTWACLSYVWGGEQRHKTTSNVLLNYLRDMSFKVLPQTIQDAVSVCRELSISYLWIDSLCIVQDDELDKAREIPQMALIYRHALLTISAANAHNVNEGFLHHQRPFCYRQFAPTSLRFRDNYGEESKAFVLAEKHDRYTVHRVNDPIDTRAWTLQEKLLSPRLLSFSSHGLLWSCRTLFQNLVEQPDQSSNPRAARTPGYKPDDVVPCIPGLEMEPWETVVQLYSSRKAKLHADKLVALSAVAQTYSENNQDYGAYLAGIWYNSLPLRLLWIVEKTDVLPRPHEYTAPTWSWASVGGAVQYGRAEILDVDEYFNFISAQTRKVSSNEFGAVTDGTLVVDARVRTYRVEKQKQKWPSPWPLSHFSDGPSILLKADTTEFLTSICNEDTEVTLLLVGHDWSGLYGLVLAKITNGGSFRRVARFEVKHGYHKESQQEYDRFHKGFEIKRVAIV